MTKENPFKKAIRSRSSDSVHSESEPKDEFVQEIIEPLPPLEKPATTVKKRGRPATGKRSDTDWIGRTYYVRRETDLDVETELLNFKRQGIELDKSDLVEALLAAWVKWQQGENLEIQLGEISPIQKSKNRKSS